MRSRRDSYQSTDKYYHWMVWWDCWQRTGSSACSIEPWFPCQNRHCTEEARSNKSNRCRISKFHCMHSLERLTMRANHEYRSCSTRQIFSCSSQTQCRHTVQVPEPWPKLFPLGISNYSCFLHLPRLIENIKRSVPRKSAWNKESGSCRYPEQ